LDYIKLDNKRIKELDICKGIGMILVILIHFHLIDGLMKYWVMSFYMSLFVIVSGLLFKRNSILYHSKKFLLNYYVFGFICVVLYDFTFCKDRIYLDLNGLIHGCTSPYYVIQASTPLWFLTMYFMLRVVYDTCDKYLKNDLLFIIVIVLGFLGCKLSVGRELHKTIYNFDLALMFVPLFHFGRIIKEKDFLIKFIKLSFIKSFLYMVVFLLLSVLLFEFNRGYDVFHEGYGGSLGGDALLFYFSSVAGTMFVLFLSRIISKIPLLNLFFVSIGRNTLIILAIHYPLTKIALKLSDKYELNWVFAVFLFLVVLFLSLVFSVFWNYIAVELISKKK